jgi:type II secretory pathway pseudopilin PulG
MTPNPYQPPVNPQPQKSNNGLIIGLLIGCGCLPLGIIVLGILAAISLPSFLNQVGKAREAEVKTNLGSLLRAQQAYLLENSRFASSINELGTTPAARYYTYKIAPYPLPANPGGTNPVIAGSTIIATPTEPNLRSAVGVIFAAKDAALRIICVSNTRGTEPPPLPQVPTNSGDPVYCPPGTTMVE